MRIVSGKYKGKNIIAPKGLPARPTTDYAKESLFNVLNNKISFEGINVLDLFAGTGNIGYEFMSRGASNITSVESDFKSIQFIKKMNKELELNNKVIRSDVFRFIKSNKGQYDLIFADPPYALENILSLPTLIFKHNLLKTNCFLIIEHDKSIDFSDFHFFENVRQYGKVNFSFFKFEI